MNENINQFFYYKTWKEINIILEMGLKNIKYVFETPQPAFLYTPNSVFEVQLHREATIRNITLRMARHINKFIIKTDYYWTLKLYIYKQHKQNKQNSPLYIVHIIDDFLDFYLSSPFCELYKRHTLSSDEWIQELNKKIELLTFARNCFIEEASYYTVFPNDLTFIDIKVECSCSEYIE